MTYNLMVRIGRVCIITDGPQKGKLVAIVNIIDANRALCQGPGVPRGAFKFRNLRLTKFLLNIHHLISPKKLMAIWKAEKINEKFAETTFAKKRKMFELRSKLSDYERYKLRKAKQMRNRIIRMEFHKLKHSNKKPRPSVLKQKEEKKQKKAGMMPAAIVSEIKEEI
ncbi:unnamed protein product [Soboliphyme baturini]|uniref:Large ribosomal subunit protein eL14 n=1 Tax=Soboliphyme baturini TaxID=241478 RepID=A0A183IBW2_9BILA|nr:unnamed protein product [Soboliphyme baturini]